MTQPDELAIEQLSLGQIAGEAAECTACELYRNATQTVFGEGPTSAKLMLLGEQPGDREDIEGEPFVGPSGKQLDKALDAADIARSEVYITNVVKHFRFEERGKRRLHKKPTRQHIMACRPWLEAELAKVQPGAIVCLGGSAAQSLLGSDIRVTEDHGIPIEWEGHMVIPTIHPSFILRSSDSARREELFDLLVSDLRVASDIARQR